MRTSQALVCRVPADLPQLQVQRIAPPRPRKGEVLVEQLASSINPIDAKRASGYGSRLLSLRGAGRFPLVLGNDIVGIVRACGAGVSDMPPGALVFGTAPTRSQGAYASHVTVARWCLRLAPAGCDISVLATLPYCFTTVWIALRGAGLAPVTAAGRKVLINGAAGALGQIALHVLSDWGARVTAIDSESRLPVCGQLGAVELVARGPGVLQRLPTDFAAILNFGGWDDDAPLSARLVRDALGHATTVHPLLAHFDRHGWLSGARAAWKDWSTARERVTERSTSARYAWTVYRPNAAALDVLAVRVAAGLALPVGWSGPMEQAAAGFAHVSAGRPGRAVLRLSPTAAPGATP
jgi:NADPH:quinone reductase-like Zn-dependent oxidoreductase